MARFKKKEEKLGYRTPDFIKERSFAPKVSPKPIKIRFTQHKG